MASAVIFDLEGTLIDILNGHVKAYDEVVARKYGLKFTREDMLKGYGMHPHRIIKEYLRRNGIDEGDCQKLADAKQALLRSKYRRELKVLPGAKKLLQELQDNGVQTALASSTPQQNVEFMLKDPGLWGYFQAIIVGEDVPEAKPKPHIFLLAAEKLGVDPGDCVVVEDSVVGLKAAKAAGMKTIAVLTGGQPKDEISREKPDILAKTLEEVTVELIRNL